MQSRPLRELFALLIVLHRLERVADQAKNICEETIFAATGETKPPKAFTILFVDQRNDRASQLAEAWARKYYPKSGVYMSAGWAPADRLSPDLLEFGAAHGLDFEGARPKAIPALPAELAEVDIVIGLEGDPRHGLGDIPFRTVVLEWDVAGRDGADRRSGPTHRGRAPEPDRARPRRACRVTLAPSPRIAAARPG